MDNNQNVQDQPVEQQSGKVVMVVEDDPVLLKMYSEKLNFEGFRILPARDGEEALKIATKENIDLILLDIMLPKMSGIDFLERFRQIEKGKATPVIALTNLTEEEERTRATKLGVEEYLVKAMQTPEEVVGKIKGYLK